MKDVTQSVSAAMLAIGDELLSGRTRDTNIAYLAENLTMAGIDLREVRIVGDDQAAIVAGLNALRANHDYVFTCGGIGPTHDDITADAVAAAFGVPCRHDPAVMEMLAAHYRERGLPFTEARKRMARLPQGAVPIDNPVSRAPGFRIGNVHVMAGVPSVFQAMVGNVLPTLKTGRRIESVSVDCPHGEGDIGDRLSDIQTGHPEVMIGSYPKFDGVRFSTEIVIRGRQRHDVETARQAVVAMIDGLKPDI